MLKIRLSRRGKRNEPRYKIVVAEHSRPVKTNFYEALGYYIPNEKEDIFECDQEKVKNWISKGAKPTDRMAVLLKEAGMSGMDKYIEARNKKRKKKGKEEGEGGDETPAAEAAPKAEEGEVPAEAPAEKPEGEAPKEEVAPEAPAEEPKAEAAPAEEAKADEEAPAPAAEEPAPATEDAAAPPQEGDSPAEPADEPAGDAPAEDEEKAA